MDSMSVAARGRIMVMTAQPKGKQFTVGLTLGEPAYHGPIGSIVRSLEGKTEAHPAAIMVHLLVGLGNLVGRNVYTMVGNTPHRTNLYGGVVGPTSQGAKGVSASTPMSILVWIDSSWDECVLPALSTGEGVIARVSDRVDKDGCEIYVDKRLFFLEEEFGRLLSVKGRDGSTLGPVLQDGWDGRLLAVPTRGAPLKAKDAHISGVVHVTGAELTSRLSDLDQQNGFANRFLWVWAQRVASIPSPKPFSLTSSDVMELKAAVQWVRQPRQTPEIEMVRSPEAEARWVDVYEMLRSMPAGRAGSLLARLAPQVVRLSMIYAMADRSAVIQLPHLEAGLAWAEYAQLSLRQIFESRTGHAIADRALEYLQEYGEAHRTTLYDRVFQRHITSRDLDEAREVLVGMGLIKVAQLSRPGGGRPIEVWRLL